MSEVGSPEYIHRGQSIDPQDLLHFHNARMCPDPGRPRKIRQSIRSIYLEPVRRCKTLATPMCCRKEAEEHRRRSMALGARGTGLWFQMCEPRNIISSLERSVFLSIN